MAQNQATNESGYEAPSRLKRNYWSTYFHIPSGKNYRQENEGNDNNWVEITAGSGGGDHTEYLNQLLDVDVPAPDPFDILVFNGSQWVNFPGCDMVNPGNSVFVSANGRTVAQGAVRESFVCHFSDINEAISAAFDGDTIYVYGGTHNLFTSMAQVGRTLKWRLSGQPVIRGFTSIIADNGVPATIDIKGDGVLEALTTSAIDITASDTIAHIECKSITGPGTAVVRLLGGREGSHLDVEDFIICTGSAYTIRFQFDSNWVINAKRIENAATSGTFRNSVIVRPDYVGTSTINAELIINTSAYQGRGVIAYQGLAAGMMTINISDKIQSNPTAGAFNHAVSFNNYKLTINGDLDGNAGNAIYTTTNFVGAGACLIHNGNAWNDGQDILINATAFSNLVKLNGTYTSSNATVIRHNNGDMEIDGKIVNTKSDGGSVGVLCISADAPVFNTAKIIMTVFDGSEIAVNATSAKNIKIIHSLVGNVDIDTINISNLIPFTLYQFDLTVE